MFEITAYISTVSLNKSEAYSNDAGNFGVIRYNFHLCGCYETINSTVI